jgi:long-chain fatty acid transport protein
MDLIVLPMLSCIPSPAGLRLNMSTSHSRRLRLLRRIPALSLAAMAVAAASSPRTAHASGFLTDQFGADHGQPALGNPYAVYFNPAAMAGMAGSEVVLDGVVAAHDEQFNRTAPLSPSGSNTQGNPAYTESNVGQAALFNVLAAPYIGFVTDFGGSKWRLGVASYIPFGGQVSWQKNANYGPNSIDPGGYDGPQRWATISASTSSIYETVALAYRLERPRIGVGANFSVIRTGLTDTRARNTDGSDDILGPTGGLKEGRAYLDMSGVEVAASAGVYWEPLRDGSLRVGASYSSAPNFGTMKLSGTFDLAQGSQVTPISNAANLVQAYPDLIRFGGAWRVSPQAEVRFDGTWQRWSQFNSQCVLQSGFSSCDTNSKGVSQATSGVLLDLPRNWNDSVKLRLGGATWITPETELWASFAWESSPVSDKNQDPLIFDSMRLEGTLGVRHAFTRHLYASAAYTYVYYLPVTVTDSAYGSYPGISASPNENGHYTSELFILDGAVGYKF